MKLNFCYYFLYFFGFLFKTEKEISAIKELDQSKEMILPMKKDMKHQKKVIHILLHKNFQKQNFYILNLCGLPSQHYGFLLLLLQNYYSEAISNLNRYLSTYPTDTNVAYAHYLIAMCYYETIEDEKRDSAPIVRAREKFNFIIKIILIQILLWMQVLKWD